MDSPTIWLIVIVVAVIAYFFFRRGRAAPQGTYDDKDVRSSGSIGGGPRAHDDANVRSGGSIGGGPSSTDSREVASGGSLGGNRSTNRSVDPMNPSGDPSVVDRDPRSDMRNATRTGVRENDTLERQNRIASERGSSQTSSSQTSNSEDRLVQLRAKRARQNPNNPDAKDEG